LNEMTTASKGVGAGERQKLQSNLQRYLTMRELVRDERAVAAIEELIGETEDHLKQIGKPLRGRCRRDRISSHSP
jgi:hypothetical protein